MPQPASASGPEVYVNGRYIGQAKSFKVQHKNPPSRQVDATIEGVRITSNMLNVLGYGSNRVDIWTKHNKGYKLIRIEDFQRVTVGVKPDETEIEANLVLTMNTNQDPPRHRQNSALSDSDGSEGDGSGEDEKSSSDDAGPVSDDARIRL